MMEFLSLLKQPENIAIILGGLAIVRGIGEIFLKIGEKIEGKDFFETSGKFILKSVKLIGKVLSFVGIGNSSKKKLMLKRK